MATCGFTWDLTEFYHGIVLYLRGCRGTWVKIRPPKHSRDALWHYNSDTAFCETCSKGLIPPKWLVPHWYRNLSRTSLYRDSLYRGSTVSSFETVHEISLNALQNWCPILPLFNRLKKTKRFSAPGSLLKQSVVYCFYKITLSKLWVYRHNKP